MCRNGMETDLCYSGNEQLLDMELCMEEIEGALISSFLQQHPLLFCSCLKCFFCSGLDYF